LHRTGGADPVIDPRQAVAASVLHRNPGVRQIFALICDKLTIVALEAFDSAMSHIRRTRGCVQPNLMPIGRNDRATQPGRQGGRAAVPPGTVLSDEDDLTELPSGTL
jgi:hypothetical protein